MTERQSDGQATAIGYPPSAPAGPTRANAITSAVLDVFRDTMSAGQLRKLAPDVESAIKRAAEGIEVVERHATGEMADRLDRLHTLRPEAEYEDDFNAVLWWLLPISEPPYCGTPGDSSWPGYHTHWSPLPDCKMLTASDGADIQ